MRLYNESLSQLAFAVSTVHMRKPKKSHIEFMCYSVCNAAERKGKTNAVKCVTIRNGFQLTGC